MVHVQATKHKYNIGDIMDTWTRQMGFPVVTLTKISASASQVKYRLDQERFLLNPDDQYDPNTSPYK